MYEVFGLGCKGEVENMRVKYNVVKTFPRRKKFFFLMDDLEL